MNARKRSPGATAAAAASSTAQDARNATSYNCVGWRGTPSPKSTPHGNEVGLPAVWSSSPDRKQPMRPMAMPSISGHTKASPVEPRTPSSFLAISTPRSPPSRPPMIDLPPKQMLPVGALRSEARKRVRRVVQPIGRSSRRARRRRWRRCRWPGSPRDRPAPAMRGGGARAGTGEADGIGRGFEHGVDQGGRHRRV